MKRTALVISLIVTVGCSRQASPARGLAAGDAWDAALISAPLRLGVDEAANASAGIAVLDDRVVVTWAATAAQTTNVFAVASEDGGRTFSAPVRVNDLEGDARVSGEQAPRVTLGESLVVGWMSRRDGRSSLRVSRSSDGGRTFASARTVNTPDARGLRGWPAFAIDADGAVHASWLDTRAAAGHAAHEDGGHHGPMRQDVFHAALTPAGTWIETTVATDVCFCCKTAVAAGPDGSIYVAWRDVYPTNLRDIAIARSTDGGRTFSQPVRVSEDEWQVDACPEDGPSLVVTGNNVVHVAWPTMLRGDQPKKAVFYAWSGDGGRTFSPRVRVDRAEADVHAGHPQMARAGERLFVTWDETTGSGYRVQLREVGSSARTDQILTLSAGSGSYPAIAGTLSYVIAAFTEKTAGGSHIVVRRLDLN